MVRLRLKRLGRRHRPFYRIVAVDRRRARDGRVIEELGYYDPIHKDPDKQLVIKAERVEYWLSVGAQPSETVHSLLRKKELVSGPFKKKVQKAMSHERGREDIPSTAHDA